MESELERAKVRLNSAQDALMDAQLTWAHAHRDWLQAVNNSARGVVSEGAMCGYTRTENGEPLDWSQCAVCQNVRWVGRVTGKCRWCYEQHKHAGKEEKGREGVCGRCGYHREPGATVCRWCVSDRAKEEKGRGNVGPHTSARASGGCACQRNHCPGCDWGTSATHHATQPTQVPGNKGPDTTSHG